MKLLVQDGWIKQATFRLSGLTFYKNFTDYQFNLKLPEALDLPTDAEIDCSWGDGSNTQTLVNDQTIVDNAFSLGHSFPINGEYNVTCRQLKPSCSRIISVITNVSLVCYHL